MVHSRSKNNLININITLNKIVFFIETLVSITLAISGLRGWEFLPYVKKEVFMYRIGQGFLGSDNIKTTSAANTEIIQQHRKKSRRYMV